MKKIILPFAVLMLMASAAVAGRPSKSDPVIMTINGKDVPLSEFEYLYNKNNTQQLERQSPDEYLDMFINYKLKVADAEAHGIDTTAAFREELESHRMELAKPYLMDSVTQAQLVKHVYDHMDRIVDVSHIMLRKGNNASENDSVKARLDSLRTAIITGKAVFEDVALQNSIDPQVRRNRGRMGWMRANVYPYSFEDVAFATPVDSISQVMETPFGFHIIRVNAIKNDPGKVNASHILKITRGADSATVALKKVQIDSIYNLVKAGDAALFSKVAKMESDDRGSASNGGQLAWFGTGEMVPEFEKVAFALADGQVSEPFESQFGYHIILRHDHRDRPSLEDEKDGILRMIARDDRRDIARKAQLDKYLKQFKGGLDSKGLKAVKKELNKAGSPDSAALAQLRKLDKVTVAHVGKTRISASEVAAHMTDAPQIGVDEWMDAFTNATQDRLYSVVTDMAIDNLPAEHADYRNLLNEYRDGILLFDISNTNVWDKALKDQDGLEKFFQAHKANYTWDKPHYKGFVVFATNDSVANAAKAYLEAGNIAGDAVADSLKTRFGRSVKVERVLAAQGDNAIVDNIAFGGSQPDLSRAKWPVFFSYLGKVINQPEQARDVRGLVGADYQQELEKQWIEELRAKYPVTVNKEVFNKVK